MKLARWRARAGRAAHRLPALVSWRGVLAAAIASFGVLAIVATRLWFQWTAPYGVAAWILAGYAAVLLLIVVFQDQHWHRELEEARDENDRTSRDLDELRVWARELTDALAAEEDDLPTGPIALTAPSVVQPLSVERVGPEQGLSPDDRPTPAQLGGPGTAIDYRPKPHLGSGRHRAPDPTTVNAGGPSD